MIELRDYDVTRLLSDVIIHYTLSKLVPFIGVSNGARVFGTGPFIYYVRTEGGSSAMRTPMYCCHSDVIICAYRVMSGSEIREFVRR